MLSPIIIVVRAAMRIAITNPVYEPNSKTCIIGPSIIGVPYAKICRNVVFVSKYSALLRWIINRSIARLRISRAENIKTVRGFLFFWVLLITKNKAAADTSNSETM